MLMGRVAPYSILFLLERVIPVWDLVYAEIQEFLNAMPYITFILLLCSIVGSIVFKKV